jgi:hypothetical protein
MAKSTNSWSSGHEKDANDFDQKDPKALEAELPEYTPGGTFETAGLENYYGPIESYEGKHRYDPEYKWTQEEEQKIIRKVSTAQLSIRILRLIRAQIDLKICTWVCLMFFALQLDRGNISQALSDNMLKDLHLNTNDYNTGQTIFYVCFLFAEVPSQLISKRIGPDRWIPIQMVSWSLVASLQAFLSGRSSFFACRALLGLIEGVWFLSHKKLRDQC